MQTRLLYGHDCAGINAPGVAWKDLGWKCVWFTEVDKFCNAVLKHHYPEVPNLGDTTQAHPGTGIDLLIGGTPCQGFSVAGARKGLDDPRSALAWNFLRLARECQPRWIIWENVPGTRTANNAQDLLAFGNELQKLGYLGGFRTFDAQYFGVPQSRDRIFFVGYSGDWRPAIAVLFDSACLSRNPEKGRETRQETASDAGSRTKGRSHWSGTGIHPCLSQSMQQGGIGYSNQEIFSQGGSGLVARYLTADNQRLDLDTENFVFDMRGGGDGQTVNTVTGDHASRPTDYTPIVIPMNTQIVTRSNKLGEGTGFGMRENGDPAFTLQENHHHAVAVINSTHSQIRRLTPRECERLMGLPDDYTRIPWRGKPAEQCPDGNRYKACGNSIAVPVLRRLGERVCMVEELLI